MAGSKMSRGLPSFSIGAYEDILRGLLKAGYVFQPSSQLPVAVEGKTAYLRHDIDLHLTFVDQMAEVEARLQIPATYYILLTEQYNPLNRTNRMILERIQGCGHEVGLHYDLETYPTDTDLAHQHLAWEVGLLENLIGRPVRTIAAHNVYKNQADPFRLSTLYVNPYNPAYHRGLTYVSDSCRAWRDTTLLTCFGPTPPPRLLMTIHPELWMDGDITDRMAYIDQVLVENGTLQIRQYLDNEVRHVWNTHPQSRMHDERESQHSGTN